MQNPNTPLINLKNKYPSNSPMGQYIKVFEDNHDDLEDFQNHIILLAELQSVIAQLTLEHYYNPNTVLKS